MGKGVGGTAPWSLERAAGLVKLHERRGFSQQELAKRSGLSKRAIGDIENARNHTIQNTTVDLIAKVLGVGAAELLAPQVATSASISFEHPRLLSVFGVTVPELLLEHDFSRPSKSDTGYGGLEIKCIGGERVSRQKATWPPSLKEARAHFGRYQRKRAKDMGKTLDNDPTYALHDIVIERTPNGNGDRERRYILRLSPCRCFDFAFMNLCLDMPPMPDTEISLRRHLNIPKHIAIGELKDQLFFPYVACRVGERGSADARQPCARIETARRIDGCRRRLPCVRTRGNARR